MSDTDVERWCQANNWSEPRQLELGIWVAFPPGGVIETPLPLQVQKSKPKLIEDLLDFFLLTIVTTIVFAIAVIISPCFIEPIVSLRRNSLDEF
ncbi:hypothetical protein I4641_00185 [Waterburya agarophytonicola K14]|uniref:Uncharacterized protein n=1 Tax=Waterburya agarophytonicola KI4 TaxID=2874699 RepID=A0A964BL48_9CYAN|nr:hypothetical protein [Waterburya agarophytonicola]MCC0175398.1 hypothetical protein [Waterburya agarophytonicola KI4]